MQMVESRRTERVRSFLRARIVFNNQNSTIDCTVKNISETGAKLDVGNALTVPAIFDLEIPQKGRSYRAKIMWRDEQSMGVTFVDERAPAMVEPSETKIERLERENRRLRIQIATLTKRIEDAGMVLDLHD